jgi:hypothetical protein
VGCGVVGGFWGGGRIGPGGRRGGGIPVRGAYAYAKTISKKPRQANEKSAAWIPAASGAGEPQS